MFVGRAEERQVLDALVARARDDGRGGALVLTGEAGVGKSALLRDAAANADGVLVLSTAGVQSETELAYAGLSLLLHGVLDALPRVPGVQREALCGALGLGAVQAREPLLVSAATLTLLGLVAERRPLLAIVDDAQWMDVASVQALAFAARRLAGEPVAIVFGLRTDDEPQFSGRDLPQLRLAGLPVETAGELMQQYTSAAVPKTVVKAAHALTAGNALALVQLTQAMTEEQLAGVAPLAGHASVHGRIAETFGARIGAMPDDTRRALSMASTSDTGDLHELQRALGRWDIGLPALDAAEAAGLVAVADGRIEFGHPLIRSVAYSSMQPHVRRDAHAALAAVLDTAGDASRRAWHLAAAAVSPDESVAAALDAAAAEARARAAPAAAAEALTKAARLTPGGGRRRTRFLAAARAHALAGAPDVAVRLLDDALEGPADPLLAADVTLERSRIEGMRGSVAAVRDMLLDGAARVERHDPARAVAMRLEAGLALFMMGRPRELQTLAEKVWPAAQTMGEPAQAMAAFLLGTSRALRGDPGGAADMLERAQAPVQPGQVSLMGPLAATGAYLMTWMGRFEEAHAVLTQLVAMARAEGAIRALPNLLNPLADTAFRLGNWQQADACAREAVELAVETGQENEEIRGRLVLALVAAGCGREDDARRDVDFAMSRAARRELESIDVMGDWILGSLEVSLGSFDAAIPVLERARRTCLERGLEEPGVAAWAQELAEAYLRTGRPDEAASVLAVLEQQARSTGRRLAHAAVERCRGLLAPDDDFEPRFAAALAWHDGVPSPHERARTELCLGERRRRARRATASRAPLTSALSTFERLGATVWAEHARRELHASGARTRRRVPGTAEALTPHEARIALLASRGSTTREIAAALFVSPRTVETHLGRAYRKLGVRSRVQLAGALEDLTDRGDAGLGRTAR